MGRKEEAVATYKEESAQLYCRDVRHDKVYNVQLIQSEAGWSVLAQSGRRGSTLVVRDKVLNADYETAKREFDKVLKEKLTKNPPYKFVEGAEPAKPVQLARGKAILNKENVEPELLTRITEVEAKMYAKRSDRYKCQRKRDGERRMVVFQEDHAYGINKNGDAIQLEGRFRGELERFCRQAGVTSLVADGEEEAEEIWLWDILEFNADLRVMPYRNRHEILSHFIGSLPVSLSEVIRLVDFESFESLLAQRSTIEGLCVKDLNASFRPGRSGQHFKLKFEQSASVIVGPKLKKDDHRSVATYLYDHGKLRYVGNVGVPDKYALPEMDQIIEVRYLYAYRGGSLYQPKYFGVVRKDVARTECNTQQLKFKQEAAA